MIKTARGSHHSQLKGFPQPAPPPCQKDGVPLLGYTVAFGIQRRLASMDMNQIELRDDEHRDPNRLRRRSTVAVVSTPSKIAPRDHVVKVSLQCGFPSLEKSWVSYFRRPYCCLKRNIEICSRISAFVYVRCLSSSETGVFQLSLPSA